MTHEEAVRLVTGIVCRLRGVEPSQVSADDDLAQTIGLDSLDAAEILASIHKETGKELDIESAAELRTVSGIAHRLTVEGANL
jgi:acyl carrier protein